MNVEEMKKRKRELGYSNEWIAELSGVPLGTVQKIFSGETLSPRYATIQKLESVLRVSDYEETAKLFANHRPIVSEPYITEKSCGTYHDYGIIESYGGVRKGKDESQYAPNINFQKANAARRIGTAAGKFKVPDDCFFYDDELNDMFEGF